MQSRPAKTNKIGVNYFNSGFETFAPSTFTFTFTFTFGAWAQNTSQIAIVGAILKKRSAGIIRDLLAVNCDLVSNGQDGVHTPHLRDKARTHARARMGDTHRQERGLKGAMPFKTHRPNVALVTLYYHGTAGWRDRRWVALRCTHAPSMTSAAVQERCPSVVDMPCR